ncbi:MAG: hydrogenase nickel incorporation protein HypB [Candidatus Wallbacteria bacterium]|nr:hydrogenase nickel incorporation protein HypB [Candidatus Wallbacteria bacterium]
MCDHCGCSTEGHEHVHEHTHEHPHEHETSRTVRIEQDILARNNRQAEWNRGWLASRRLVALNLVGSPGSGKTTVLERTLKELDGQMNAAVIEGDQATDRDAARIRATGRPVVQIATGTGCHLDARMVKGALEKLDPQPDGLVFVENVGNLVCPALFDLGEQAKVLIASVTEGEDKPAKYPHMFAAVQVVLLNKIDLLPHVSFEMDAFLGFLRQVNPRVRVIAVSGATGAGMLEWYECIRASIH